MPGLWILLYCAYNQYYKYRYLAGKKINKVLGAHQIYRILQGFLQKNDGSKRTVYPPKSIREIARSSCCIGFGTSDR